MRSELVPWPIYPLVLGGLCGVVGFRLGWRSGSRWALPIAEALAGFVAFAATWHSRGARAAALAVIGWAMSTSLVSIAAFGRDPERADRMVLRARAYREEMLAWLRSGEGPETRIAATCRAHLRELAVYLTAAALTCNLLSMVMGAALLNEMNAYVSRLLLAARRVWIVRLLAWNPWSLVRVAAYVMLGVAAASPLASYLGHPARPEEVRSLALLGLGGVGLDLALKLVLSRPCGRVLSSAVALEP